MGVKVAIDCMGGDHGPRVTVPATLAFLRAHAEAAVILVGNGSALQAELDRCGAFDAARPTRSVPPPGGNGTINRMALFG